MIVSVVYPVGSGQKFDVEYYKKSHMPLVDSLLRPSGLKRAQYLHATGAPGGQPEIKLIALLEFDSLDAFKTAMDKNGAALMGDIANFTDVQPSIQFNEQLI